MNSNAAATENATKSALSYIRATERLKNAEGVVGASGAFMVKLDAGSHTYTAVDRNGEEYKDENTQ